MRTPTSVPLPVVPERSSLEDQASWFAQEVHPHESALRAYLHGTFPGMQDVDDVIQDSYLKLLKARPAGKIASGKAYLFATARNAALKVFRKRSIISDIPVNELPDRWLLDGGQNVVEIANAHVTDELIADAAAQLPDRCREIFKLRIARGLSHAEIAVQLGISEGTVRVQVARGLTRCAQYLHDRGITPDK